MEDNFLDASGSGVEISITSPSTNVSEDEEEFIPRALRKSKPKRDSSNESNNFNNDDIMNGADGGNINGEASGGDILSEELNRKLSLVEKSESKIDDQEHVSEERNDEEELDEKPANLEMIGDRVLIERDGKFELVDVSEIKAEYFEMLGIDPQEKKAEATTNGNEINGVANGVEERKKSPKTSEEKHPINKPRPKTTNVSDYRQKRGNRDSGTPERRSTSAKISSTSEDYAHIKSVYGMTEEQLKIKRRREEAVAKRKKEEKEREDEELRRKRDDAESAFQAWLVAKLEEAKERKEKESQNKSDETLKDQKSLVARQAYEEWLAAKRQQHKIEREYEELRQSEEASQFIIRDRQLCDEAFRRWMRKKRADAKAKEKLKKKRKSKPKLKKKEPLPLNSKNITYLEYYGYRNDVVL